MKMAFDEKPLAMECGFDNMSQLPGASSINYKPLSHLQVRALAAFSNGKRRHGCSRMLASKLQEHTTFLQFEFATI